MLPLSAFQWNMLYVHTLLQSTHKGCKYINLMMAGLSMDTHLKEAHNFFDLPNNNSILSSQCCYCVKDSISPSSSSWPIGVESLDAELGGCGAGEKPIHFISDGLQRAVVRTKVDCWQPIEKSHLQKNKAVQRIC